MEQIELTKMEYPKECRYCIYWELLPPNEQKEGWGVIGACTSPRCKCDTSDYWTRCENFTEITCRPIWEEQVSKLPNRGKGITIKEAMLEVRVDITERVIRNKHGIIIERY